MNFLTTILEQKRKRLEAAKKLRPIEVLKDMEWFHRETISLCEALARQQIGVIAEMKKASPSKGILRKQYDPVAIAKSYIMNGATAISVLTEEDFFSGNLEHLKAVRSSVLSPLLRKDFITDSYELYEAKAYGADAILLIVAACERSHLLDLLLEAKELGLEAVVEVHSIYELEILPPLSSITLLGVNNRDLTTFAVDLTTVLRIKKEIPDHITLISESGIQRGSDIRMLYHGGIKNFLIGEAFMRATDPGVALRNLIDETRILL
ncbi:MAG: indole-3-glycerol phosphate synthase TrpC [Bacteroidetes bacterium]|nr:indole-3-glycerol phosphate synthase TrpC [Bacteroidota bacterium]